MLAPAGYRALTAALPRTRPGGKRTYTHHVQRRPRPVEFKILGDTVVLAGGEPLGVGGPRNRAVLAMLTVNAGRVVAADVLQDELWPGLPPGRAAASLQVRVSELRGALRPAGLDQRLVTRPPGYLLRAEPEEVDASHFEALLARGRGALASGDARLAADHLRAALALWRGPALAGLADVPFARAEGARLDEARLEALELRIGAELGSGGGAELVAELEVLTARHPLRERLWAQRMLALYRAGRQADALRCYTDLRATLTGELGIEPGREARRLETLILRQDPSLDAQPPGPSQLTGQAAGGPAPEIPETRYAVSGNLHVAYQVTGSGEPDILFVPGLISHLDLWWEEPVTARFFRRLASLGRLILFDKRDTGLSDRAPGDTPLEERMTDLQAVMDACGSRRAVLFGYSEGAPMSLLFAATHPERVAGLILGSAAARWRAAADYPCGRGSEAMFAAFEQMARDGWGTGASVDWYAQDLAGSPRTRQRLARWERMAVSPSALLRMVRMCHAVDVRGVLPAIHAPTLIIQRLDDRITPPCHGRYLAAHLEAARYFEQPGNHLLWTGDTDSEFAQIDELLTGSGRHPGSDRVLRTLLAADTAERDDGKRAGGQRRARTDAYEAAVRDAISAYGGRLLGPGETGVLATFDGPARAIRCASMLRDRGVAGLGMQLCLGIHCGEVDVVGDTVSGIAADIATRLAALARPGEVLASRTVKDLVAGSGISFTDRGTHQLPDLPDPWSVFAVGEVSGT
jgi:DNA-binding SARP family transcriptional activator/pimeloyl-ACP methyl ester carboxylesterase